MEEINEILSRLSIQSVDETRTDDAHVIQQWTAASQAACSPMTLKRVEEYLMVSYRHVTLFVTNYKVAAS